MIREFTRGPFDASDLRRLQQLEMALKSGPAPIRYLSYAACEEAAERLASQILEVVPREQLADWTFLPNPRGGFFVLGMLSYFLRLEPDQLPPEDAGHRPVVLVDDVALTGARLKSQIEKLHTGRLVVALLASHPALRAAVETENRVEACLSGIDLEEVNQEGESRLSGDSSWHEHSEMIAFPWSEPDQLLWDPTISEEELGWRLVSPELVLKSRAALGPPSPSRSTREFGFPGEMAHGAFGDDFLVCLLPSEEVFRLDALAATVWGALGTLGDVEAAHRYLLEAGQPDVDVSRLADELLDAGLLVRLASRG